MPPISFITQFSFWLHVRRLSAINRLDFYIFNDSICFFWGEGDFLPTYTYRLANRTQQVEIDFSYIDVSPLLNVLIPQHSNFGGCLKSTQHNVTGLAKYRAHFYFRKYISFDNCGTVEWNGKSYNSKNIVNGQMHSWNRQTDRNLEQKNSTKPSH